MKNFIKLSLCALILFTATSNVWGGDLGKCKIYFDNSQWHWGSVTLHIWNNSGSQSNMNLSKIDGSDYWVTDQNGWNGFDGYQFTNGINYSNTLTDALTDSWITRCFSGDGNQNWTLVGPKNVGITNTTSNTQGGNGTEANPYVVLPGTTITVSAAGDKIDDNTTVYYKFNVGTTSYSTTKTNTVVNSAVTGTTYSVKATVKTNRDKYNSREFDTQTLYYIAVDPCPSCKYIEK